MSAVIDTVRVSLGPRSYEIRIGTGILPQAADFWRDLGWSHVVLIADQQVADSYGQVVADTLRTQGRVSLLTVPSGEPSKSLGQAERLWNELLDCRADRKTLVVAVGGGVVGDLAGFVAASFARGLRFVQVPTTLLAQVDSSVGGKVGINLPRAKNMVGAFWQPQAVLIDTDTLHSLPPREYRSGLAEVVKYGVILDAEFFDYLETHAGLLRSLDPPTLRHVIGRCCELKAQVVEQDEHETRGLRAVLNYGHTFAHALESVGGYGTLLHGEAVSIGMLCASRLAERLGAVPPELTERQRRLLVELGLPVQLPPYDVDQLLAAMTQDKKVEHGRLHFVLPTRMGHVHRVSDVDWQLVRELLTELAAAGPSR